MTLTLNQLRYFRTLAETGHFGRAAQRLNLSQPPLSRQMALLEQDLGTRLMDRTPKGVALTSAGRQFCDDATVILRLVAQARQNAAAAGRGEAGQLTIGFTMCAAYSVVPMLTRLYQQAFPKVDLRIRELMPTVLERDLMDGSIDFAISFPGIENGPFKSRVLLREPLNVALPEGHPLAMREALAVEDLARERFLIVPRDQAAALYDSVVHRCEAAGFHPVIGLEVYLQQTIVNLVAEGLGIAFVPASMQRSKIEGVVFRSVEAPPSIDQLLFWSPTSRNPCIAGFLETCDAMPPLPA